MSEKNTHESTETGVPVVPVAPGSPVRPWKANAAQRREQLAQVGTLARMGLVLEEIQAELDWPPVLEARWEQQARAAIERGRLLGRAGVKRKLYETAMVGGISAMKELLDMLEANGGEDWDEEQGESIEIVRIHQADKKQQEP
ncbi:MAG: hypothetical protein OEZ59_02855 [Deltaproteobacteria bacterium]|nr:hypothetical protein [Deltaproteobacteria bacterium]